MKALLLVPMLLFAVFFTGCSKDGDVVIPNRTIVYEVQPQDWAADDQAKLHFVRFEDVVEIDNAVAQRDGIIVALSVKGSGVYEAIPDVFNGYSFSYTYEPGMFELVAQNADGSQASPPKDVVLVKITIVQSQ